MYFGKANLTAKKMIKPQSTGKFLARKNCQLVALDFESQLI